MGFTYRKSVNLGPFRVNLSKSGIGYSVGGRCFRTGVSVRGKPDVDLDHKILNYTVLIGEVLGNYEALQNP